MAQYFNLTLDTTAPSGGILSGLQNYYNSNATVNISATGASYMKIWVNNNASGSTSDSNYPSDWEAYQSSKTVTFTAEGQQYVHAQFMDEVGNIGIIINSSSTIYDRTAPTISTVSINSGAGYTKQSSNTVRVSFSDATSGVATITLSGNIASSEKKNYTVSATEKQQGYKDILVTFSSPDGTKTVSATATDAAGNTSSMVSDTIVYDTTAAVITAVLRDVNNQNNLPVYTNSNVYGVLIATEATDIVSYKIWEGNTEPSTWNSINGSSVSVTDEGYFIIPDEAEYFKVEGFQTVHVKVQDSAGNVTEAPTLSTIVDGTAPVVEVTDSTPTISSMDGYNLATINFTVEDTNKFAGLSNELQIYGEHGYVLFSRADWDGSFRIHYSELEAAGYLDGIATSGYQQLLFKIKSTDAAGNSGESTTIILYVDVTSPTGTITANSLFNTSSIYVSVSASSGEHSVSPVTDMKVWLDNNEPADWESYHVGYYPFTGVAEGSHIAYAEFRNSVGVVSSTYDTSFIVDTTAPTGTIFTSQYTNSRTITINVNASDAKNSLAVSGVDKMKIWEAGQTEPSVWDNYAATKSITLAEGNDGIRTINAKFKDMAGNETATANIVTCTTTLDLDDPDATLILLKTDGNGLPTKVNYRDFKARIGHTAPDTAPISQYKLTGDFTQSSSDWKTFTPDSGQDYMTISSLTLTTGEGLKTITVQLKDAAGNVSSEVIATVTYDTSAPVIDVNAPDYNVVSKQHTLRLNASGSPISETYNDMCIFTWSSNENLVAYKVCVNEPDQAAAEAEAIGTSGGSLNMTGGATAANALVISVIYGADFAATDAVNDTDGAYEIIVYGQDEGGTWSAIHALPTDNEPTT